MWNIQQRKEEFPLNYKVQGSHWKAGPGYQYQDIELVPGYFQIGHKEIHFKCYFFSPTLLSVPPALKCNETPESARSWMFLWPPHSKLSKYQNKFIWQFSYGTSLLENVCSNALPNNTKLTTSKPEWN